jgi:peptide/nickel transport system permease protein
VPVTQLGTELELLGTPSAEPSPEAIEGRSPWQLAWARLRRDRVAIACAVVIVLIALVAIWHRSSPTSQGTDRTTSTWTPA